MNEELENIGNQPESQDNSNQIQESGNVSSNPPMKKKRRWWIYLLIGFGGIFLLALIVFVIVVTYYKSLVNNYTETKPKPLPAVEASKERVQDIATRWQNFCQDVFSKRASEPFKLTDEDINQMIANFPKAKDNLRIEITNDQILAHITIPLDGTRRKELQGRYLNAVANLKLQLEDGFLTLRVHSATANGKPIPQWIINRIGERNFLQDLERNYDFLQLLQEMESVEVKDGAIVFTPIKPGK